MCSWNMVQDQCAAYELFIDGLIVHLVFVQCLVQFLGVDPLQAGNVVQLVLVLGLTVGWISTYIFRVSNKEMTYAQQLRDYEDKVMQVSFYFRLHSVLVSSWLLNVTCILVLCFMHVQGSVRVCPTLLIVPSKTSM